MPQRRKYKPQPVLRVEIPKPNGGVRKLGIPTIMDRIIEQAVVQVITPIVEPHFSEYSYGFRPGRRPLSSGSQDHRSTQNIKRNPRKARTH